MEVAVSLHTSVTFTVSARFLICMAIAVVVFAIAFFEMDRVFHYRR